MKFLTILLSILLILSSCSFAMSKTITGIAEETKDGYYVENFLLPHDEIEDFDSTYEDGEYDGAVLKIKAKFREVEETCENEDGEVTQCREGTYNELYDIELLEVVE